MDDPLRVIRCIRFASRFGFEMDPDLQQAAQLEKIQDVITQKISRERVGEEIDKMMKGSFQLFPHEKGFLAYMLRRAGTSPFDTYYQ